MECSIKSTLPSKCSRLLSNRFSMSSGLVTSAGITGALHFSANWLIAPIRRAIGAVVSTIWAPSSTHFSAVFQAMDFSSNAPKIIPFFPFNRLLAIFQNYVLFHQFLCIFQGGRRGVFPAQHLGDFQYALLFLQLPDIGKGTICFTFFINKIVGLAFSGNLRKMGDRNHLQMIGKSLHQLAHLQGHFTRDS